MTTVFAGMAASLDGFIQSASGDLSWLNDAMAPGEDYGFAETEARTGAYVIGANTYREMGRSAGGGVPTYVVTHDAALASGPERAPVRRRPGAADRHRAGRDRPRQGHLRLRRRAARHAAPRARPDRRARRLAVIPVVLGSGVPFFGTMASSTKLELMECRPFPSGIVLLNYRIVRS